MLFVTSSVAGPKMGGVLKVILDEDPPTLDPHSSSTTLVFVVGYHMFEGLYSLDENLNPFPMLAADLPEISEDNLVTRVVRSAVLVQMELEYVEAARH